MRAHHLGPKKLPTAWRKLSASWAASSEPERAVPHCSVPPCELGFPELVKEYFDSVFFLLIKSSFLLFSAIIPQVVAIMSF